MLLRVAHIAIALILLINTTGVMLNSHYCGEYLTSLSVFLDAKPCCENEKETDMGNCCHDESLVLQMDEDFVKANSESFNTLPAFTYVLQEYTFLATLFSTSQDQSSPKYYYYSPPLLSADIPIEVQSFLL
jgi:hypothetical protein